MSNPTSGTRSAMTAEQMRAYLTEVGARLAARAITGEIVLAGEAVMVMVLAARDGSHDIDALFVAEGEAIKQAAGEVAEAHGLPAIWLNEPAGGFIPPNAPIVDCFEVPGLRVRMVGLDYLFYMKAWAGDPIDQRDMRAIARALGLKTESQAYTLVAAYSGCWLPQDIQILLDDLFP